MKHKAFTLAEVLIALAIIGVVAALVIPPLKTNIDNAQYVVALKKAYSTLSNMHSLYIADKGRIKVLFNGDGDAADDVKVLNTFAKYLKISKNCGSGMNCWYDSELKRLDGSKYTDDLDDGWNGKFGKAILADGSLIAFDDYSGICSTSKNNFDSLCGVIAIDINGYKGPNVIGRDYFGFFIKEDGIYPQGSFDDGYTCDLDGFSAIENLGCTAKVLQEGAMDY